MFFCFFLHLTLGVTELYISICNVGFEGRKEWKNRMENGRFRNRMEWKISQNRMELNGIEWNIFPEEWKAKN